MSASNSSYMLGRSFGGDSVKRGNMLARSSLRSLFVAVPDRSAFLFAKRVADAIEDDSAEFCCSASLLV